MFFLSPHPFQPQLSRTLNFLRAKFYIFSYFQIPPKTFHSTPRTLENICMSGIPNILFQPRPLFLALDLYAHCLCDIFTWKLPRNPKFNVANAKVKIFHSQIFSFSSNLQPPTHEHLLSCCITSQSQLWHLLGPHLPHITGNSALAT